MMYFFLIRNFSVLFSIILKESRKPKILVINLIIKKNIKTQMETDFAIIGSGLIYNIYVYI